MLQQRVSTIHYCYEPCVLHIATLVALAQRFIPSLCVHSSSVL
jgi:hypothetical protein